jgi:hypothetical protein
MSAKLQVVILWLALYEKHHINMGCNLSHYSVMQSCVTQDVTKNMCTNGLLYGGMLPVLQ